MSPASAGATSAHASRSPRAGGRGRSEAWRAELAGHETVSHQAGEYVRRPASLKGIKGFWAFAKDHVLQHHKWLQKPPLLSAIKRDFDLGEQMKNVRNILTVIVAALSLGILGACSGEMNPTEDIQRAWLVEPGAEDEGMIRFNDDDQVIFETQGERFHGEYIIDEEGSLTVNIGQMTFTGKMLSKDSLRVDSRGDIDTLVARD